mmetsp:Transcript_42578/g.76283  ORF Transcript_42578/g.76283 Transcript_42578/m.76283 type:complete len:133 (+) Transcript_42578:1560-1958(+)
MERLHDLLRTKVIGAKWKRSQTLCRLLELLPMSTSCTPSCSRMPMPNHGKPLGQKQLFKRLWLLVFRQMSMSGPLCPGQLAASEPRNFGRLAPELYHMESRLGGKCDAGVRKSGDDELLKVIAEPHGSSMSE